MNESKLADRLHHLASDMPVDLERSVPSTLRRARVRRGATALLSSAIVVAVVLGGVAIVRVAAPERADGPNPVVPATEGPTPVLPGEPGFAGLWPETTPEALAEAQTAVDDGHQPLRLDPEQTAVMLATNLFGWTSEETEPSLSGDDPLPVVVELRHRSFDPDLPPIVVELLQLGRTGPNGIWSVVGVSSPMIANVDVHPLDDGARIGIEGTTKGLSETAAVFYEIRNRGLLSDEGLACCAANVTGVQFTGDWSTAMVDPQDATLWIVVMDSRVGGEALAATAVKLVAFEAPIPEPTEAPPPPAPGFVDLPPDVAVTAQRVLEAARARDVDALAELVNPERFSYNFGAVGDPVAAWREDPSVLDPIAQILALPYTIEKIEGSTDYVWPYLMEDGALDDISGQERADLHSLGLTDEHIVEMQEFGGYLGPRLGIDETGAWRYYVTGGD
ncbi:MAG TPA: hypothetical protein VF129_10785 [Actinomycetota bacterium]